LCVILNMRKMRLGNSLFMARFEGPDATHPDARLASTKAESSSKATP
jgi:hypothetical protein